MNPEVIIIAKKNEPALKHLHKALRQQMIRCETHIHSPEGLQTLDTSKFVGFFIFCLPPSEVSHWLKDVEVKFLNHFKIYSYDYLVADEIDCSTFLIFDYIIAGIQEYKVLMKHLQYLKNNYWRKIPVTKLGLRGIPDSILLSKLFRLLERIDVDAADLDQISKRLNVKNNKLQKEIKQHLNLQYGELKTILVKHYEEYF